MRQRLSTPTPQHGFTLIELLVVVAIIGVLASSVLTSLQDARAQARDTARLQAAKQLQTALEIARNNNGGFYPCLTSNCVVNTTLPAQPHHPANAVSISGSGVTFASIPLHRDFLAAINYDPGRDPVYGIDWYGGMQYRLRSNAGGNNGHNPDRTSYTIQVRFERGRVNSLGQTIPAGSWCSINQGPGHRWWNDVLDTVPPNAGEQVYPLCF